MKMLPALRILRLFSIKVTIHGLADKVPAGIECWAWLIEAVYVFYSSHFQPHIEPLRHRFI